MSEDFDREDDLQFLAQPYLFKPEYTDNELREMDILRQKGGSCVSSTSHVSWYSCEDTSKTDMEEKKLLNEVAIFVLIIIINNSLHLYSAFLGTQSALHRRGGSPQPPPVCSIHLDDATAAILRQNAHHTPATGGEETEWWSQSVYGCSFHKIKVEPF